MRIEKRLEILEERVKKNPKLIHTAGGISQKSLQEAEKRLGGPLPLSYCWFLRLYGEGLWGGWEIFGLREDEWGNLLEGQSVPDMLWTALYMRERYQLPREYIPVAGDGMETYYFIKTIPEGRREDGAMVALRLTEEGEFVETESLEITFGDFLEECLEVEEI